MGKNTPVENAKSERVCSSAFHFDMFKQKILVGFAREVVPAENIQICMSACLNSFDTFGFECESAMYYPVDQECILNTEDRLDRPDLFVDETDDTVIYIDNNCAGSQCYAPYITQYIAVEGMQLENELDRIINVDVDSCQSLCTQRLSLTVNDFNCKSFMYNNESRTCILSDERSKPLGRGSLIKTEGFTYYEKKCFAFYNKESCGTNHLCLLIADNLLMSLNVIIIMHSIQVDYFDISCHLKAEKCPKGTHLKAVRTVNAALAEGEGDLHVLKTAGKGVKQCVKKCFDAAPEKCRSFNFDKRSGVCNLLYLDSVNTLRPQIRQGTDLYEMHCLAAMPLVEGECSNNKDEALFSRYLHTKQRGIASKTYKVVSLNSCLEVCAGNPTCAGVNYNRRVGQCDIFDSIDDAVDVNEHVDFYKNLCVVKEVDGDISAAANVPPETHRLSGTVTSKKDSRAELLATKKIKPSIREQEHRRKPESKISLGPPVSIPKEAVQTICNYEGIKVQVNHDSSFNGVIFVKNKYDSCRVEVANSKSATLVLGLPKDFGMRPISLDGVEEVANSKSATLVLGLPKDFGMRPISLDGVEEIHRQPLMLTKNPAKALLIKDDQEEFRHKRQVESRDCGLIDMLNGTYKTTVVIQTNNLGIPGLVTSMDQLYEVSCDYSSMLGGKVQAGYNMTVLGPEANLIQPRGKIELGNPVFMQLVSGEGEQPVVQAKLGDILELRWEIMAMDDELDFFVKDCFAEPGVSPKADEKLDLIEGGCPTAAVAQKLIPGPIEIRSSAVKVARMQAFRFDSSSSIRITCEIDICKGNCTPIECGLTDGLRQSWGRKKRESENSILEYETARYRVPKQARATTSIVVIDPLQQVQEPVSLARASAIDFLREEAEEIAVPTAGQMCLAKPTLFAVFGLLLTLTLIQAIVVIQYLIRRFCCSSKQ
ncbi:PAN domain protein [Dictyocaulus viviparus]|uniref:PAN domain protein n=1 Tax=Dictyocaulus viviparus TaxID=29172 RepID=A0A0D8Y6A7_DICVI|nr:PAN domain protein [Dictyocaulus viviparus]